MTSVQSTQSQSQATSSSASQPTLSYANTAKKAVSSPPIATGSSPSPAVAVGASAPLQQHGKSSSVSPVNGRSAIPPAVPAVSAPAIAHGSSTVNGGDHSRKPSVTIANGPSSFSANGGPVGGSKAPIQFGFTDSPAASHSTPAVVQSTGSAPMPIPGNPRVSSSPAQSPSPIPQPTASGGRPPSALPQGNGMTFGSHPGDGDRHMRQASGNQASLAPNNASAHLRRESSQSAHSDMSNQGPGAGRGGFQGGRGRGQTFAPQFQPNSSNMGYPPAGNNFRNVPAQGRGAPSFQAGRPMQFPNSPHQAGRSPALSNSIPGTPNMGQAMPMANQQQYYNQHQQTYMPGPQVQPPSTFGLNSQAASFQPQLANSYYLSKNGNGKKRQKDKSSRGNHNEQPRQTASHAYSNHEPSMNGSNGQNGMMNGSKQWECAGSGHSLHDEVNDPFSQQLLEHERSISPLPSLPPRLPSPHISLLIPYPRPDVNMLRKIDISPAGGGFEQALTKLQQQNFSGYPPQYVPQMGHMPGGVMPMQNSPYMYPQIAQMNPYMGGVPQSPQPGYQQTNSYTPGQYGNQAPPMSRNSSQMSEQRPASSMGGPPGTPSVTPAAPNSHTPQPKAAPAASPSAFARPARKSAAILIKKPDGEAVDLSNFKAPASPAPRDRTRTPPVITSTPTPPPKTSTPLHNRTDSSAVGGKNAEQVRLEIMEKVKKAAESEKASDSDKADEAAKAAADSKIKEEQKVKDDAKVAEDAKAAEEQKKKDEEEELERQIREIEEAEAEEEKRQAEITEKKAAEKKAADEAAAEKRKANAAEEDRKLQEAEREMERLEDEKERKRAEAEGKAAKPDAEETREDTSTTPSTLASKLSNLSLEAESGTSTPASDDSSMGPPKIPAATEKRGKPAALNLAPLNTKPVEAPQPSAALNSLKSARFLSVLNSSIYPPNINSPNPALNSAVEAKGKNFKYDKEFLLQFQKVFTEKPSMEFESQIKALIGDGDGGSARSASTRGGSSMGPRQGSSRNNPPGAFAMGSFGAVGGKTLPPGTTSEQRFAMANNSMPRPAVNPMASFSRPGGAFPGGNSMSRGPSSSAMGSMPHSPRQGSRSQRGGSKRDGYQPSNAKQEAQAAKTMPLTAGMDLKPIKVSETGWKPRSIGANQSATGAAGPTPGNGGDGLMQPDMVQRKVKAALNKMTPEKFDKIADQILTIAAQSKDEQDGRTLRQVIQLTFEKATDEAHWASMYAKFCKRMLETMNPDIKDESILDKNGNVVSGGNLFRKYLLNRCQEEFERGWKMDLPDKPEGEKEDEKTGEAAMLSEEYYIAAAAKRRGLGLVQFIGELYKLGMLTERIMHECVKKLVDYTGIPDEAEIESLTKLLKTIGANLDSTEKGKPMMDVYFTRIQTMIETPDLPSRLRFMLMDIVDLRKARWQSKENNKGPKTLEEVRVEAEAAAAQKAAENARGPRGGGGGGGRMPMGRGDSRNFSNQYGQQPPPDYQKNTVGMDDLRRLTNKNANRASSQQMSFGPTSMFSSRSNSGRKMGPGGSLSRTGEDSGASSRTGTPPQAKEKESATSANAFSLLAGLGSSEGPENPASPPSASNSPELSKASPAGKFEDTKESES